MHNPVEKLIAYCQSSPSALLTCLRVDVSPPLYLRPRLRPGVHLGARLDLNLDLNLDGVNVVDVVVTDHPRQRIGRVLSLKARRPRHFFG
jgi:hypothetical protein